MFSDTLIDNPLIKNYQHITEAVAQRCSVKNRSEKFHKITTIHLYRGVSFNKVQVISLQLSEQRHFGAGVPLNFAKYFRMPLFQNSSGRLLLTLTFHEILDFRGKRFSTKKLSYKSAFLSSNQWDEKKIKTTQ